MPLSFDEREYEEVYDLLNNINIIGTDEVVFSKFIGHTSTTSSTTLTLGSFTNSIIVEESGVISQSEITVMDSTDSTLPTVDSFDISSIPCLTSNVLSFTASDNVGVTGYLINQSSTTPSVDDPNWTVGVPASYTFSGYGTTTVYAWAKDAEGNISNSQSKIVTVRGQVTFNLASGTGSNLSSYNFTSGGVNLTVAISVSPNTPTSPQSFISYTTPGVCIFAMPPLVPAVASTTLAPTTIWPSRSIRTSTC